MTNAASEISPSQGWVRYAQEIVGRAAVMDDRTASVLMDVLSRVPRTCFLPDSFRLRSKQDVELPIGFGQNMLRPSLIVRMLSLIGLREGMRVLEIGCGSGYASSLMAKAGAEVYALESNGLLAQQTRKRLDALGFQRILIRRAEYPKGWAEFAPFDAIVSFDISNEIKPRLLSQLGESGRLAALVNSQSGPKLHLWEKRGEEISSYELESVSAL